MSWEAMEVSMSKTRRGKYTESDICVFTQVQNVVCLPIQFFTYSSNCSYPMRGKSFSFYRGKLLVAVWHVLHDETDYVDFKLDREESANNG